MSMYIMTGDMVELHPDSLYREMVEGPFKVVQIDASTPPRLIVAINGAGQVLRLGESHWVWVEDTRKKR